MITKQSTNSETVFLPKFGPIHVVNGKVNGYLFDYYEQHSNTTTPEQWIEQIEQELKDKGYLS